MQLRPGEVWVRDKMEFTDQAKALRNNKQCGEDGESEDKGMEREEGGIFAQSKRHDDMEHDSNILSTLMALLGATIANFYSHLAPWLLLGAVVIIVDLRFGIKAAKARGETVRTSRAIRRTLNKSIDYLGVVTLAEMLSRTYGVSLGAPVVSIGVLFLVYGIEISSILNNYFEYKGLPWRFNLLRFLRKKSEVADAIEEGKEVEPDNIEKR